MAKISKTKQRILDSAKRLFNDQRYGNVTIKEIAADLGISTGNVWYHYKDKREILRGLNEEFLIAAKQRMALLPSGGAVIPEFGHFAMIVGLALALLLTVVPAWGAWQRNVHAMSLAPGLAVGMLVFVTISFIALCVSFLHLRRIQAAIDSSCVSPCRSGVRM